jgi:hypothetical protein
VAERFDERFSHYDISSIPLAIAGLWHAWTPPRRRDRACSAIRSAFRRPY